MRGKQLGSIGLVCVFTLALGLPLHWRAISAGMPVHWRAHSRSLPAPHVARIAVQAAGRGFPWINLRDGQELLTNYTGAAANELAAAQPLALAAGDFDEDGVPDLLSGYASADGGALVWQRGNVDAIYPDTTAAEQRRARGEFTDAPFLSPARVFALPAAADFVGAGDFNADGHVDVVAATRGSAKLYWLAGDGRGGLGQAQAIELPGSVTALVTGEINRADGLADVIVSVNTDEGAQALVLEGPEGAFSRAPEVIALPAEATALALGQLDEQYEMDLAVAAGQELLIVHGRDRCLSVGQERQAEVKPAAIEEHALAFHIVSLAVGDFSGDQHAEIAVLSADGVVQVLGQDARSKQWGTPLGEVATRSQREAATTADANDQLAPLAAPLLVRARVSVSGYDDLVVIDRNAQQLQILTGGMLRGEEAKVAAEPREPIALEVAGEPVAVLPLRLNMDALSDLVVLKRGGESSVAAALTAPTGTYTVNSTGNEGDANQNDGKCETAPGNGVCTLLAAVQQATSVAGADLINFSPSVRSITLTVTLFIGEAITIDGGSSRVELSGRGMEISGGSCVLRGLVLNRVTNSNQAILLTAKGGNFIEGCYVGTDVAGANASFGTSGFSWPGITTDNSPNNVIGGTTAAARNILSVPSIAFRLGAGSPDNKLKGNYIGTDVTSTKALSNIGTGVGVSGSANQSLNLLIGGTEAGARNVIAGNQVNVLLQVQGSTGVLVQGNLIGTDVTGTVAVSKTVTGTGAGFIFSGFSGSTGLTIGGTTPAARNIISGHKTQGLRLANVSAALVQGNYIGTDSTGAKDLGNTSEGVVFDSGVSRSTLGGTAVGARNLISANNIGVVINAGDCLVQGNYIGTDVNGTANLGNRTYGVRIDSGTGNNNNLIGGTDSGAANIIAFNNTLGVIYFAGGTGATVRRNSIFSNGTPVTTANGISNSNSFAKAPVLTTTNGVTQGTLSGAAPNTAHTIEFFSNPTCGADTQGKTYIGDMMVTTLANGTASFNVPAGQNVTATATATGGSTSSFSTCAAGGAPGTLTLSTPTLNFNTTVGSNPATQTVTLSNTGGGALTWQAAATTTTSGSGGNWLTVTPLTGPLNAGQSTTLTVAVNASALAPGTYNGTLTVTSANASNSPRTVAVTLTVAGCPATLGQTANAPEQSQDTLTLTKVMPANGEVVSGANLKRSGLKAKVTWLLQSSDAGVIDVTLYDQSGNIRFDGGTIPVRKSTCPAAQDIVLDLSRLDLSPRNGVAVTSLKLTAKLLNSSILLKQADLNYNLPDDTIAFEGTPTINGQSAPDGGNLPANGMVNFNCVLRYLLANDTTGRLRVQALNESGGVLASKDLGTVSATAQAALWTTPLDFQFTVPANVSPVRVVAALLAGDGSVLKTSTPLTYGVAEVKLQFGYYQNLGEPQSFAPLDETRIYGSGIRLSNHPDPRFRRPVIRAAYRNVGDPANKFLRLRRTGFVGETVVSLASSNFGRDIPKTPTQTDGFVDFCLTIRCEDAELDFDHLDRMDFRVELGKQTDGSLVTTSTAVTIYFHRVRLGANESPAANTLLPPGQSREFAVTLNYNLIRPGTNIYAVIVEHIGDLPDKDNLYRALVEPIPLRTNLSAGVSGEARFTFNAIVPPRNPTGFYVGFYLNNDPANPRQASALPLRYLHYDFEPEKVQPLLNPSFPGGKFGNSSGGTGQETYVFGSSREFRELLIFGNRNRNQGQFNAFAAAEREAAAQTFFPADFIGIKACWLFDPPIPAASGFTTDLRLDYTAQDLPDDPNFSEAAMRIIAFDPATGSLESYPATIDVQAKTATARIKGLLPLYTLGVFGPFAQRTLNFPVLQNFDNLDTRFNLVNAGTPNASNGDAALTLRAYDNAGQTLQTTNLVNPLTATLAAARMLLGSVGDLFRTSEPLDGWVQTRANRNFVAGYELLTSGNRLDGLNAPSGYGNTFILPEAFYEATQTTEVQLANITNFAGLVELELRDATGRLAASADIRLAAKARFASRLPDIFPTLAQPFAGYLLITSECKLTAAALQILDKEISALNAQPLGGGATKLYAPYLSLGGPTTARLTLVNPTAQAANLTLRLISNKPGTPTIAPVNLTLGAGQQLQRNFSQLFTLNQLSFTYFTLIVESNLAGLAGNVTLLNPSGAIPFRATLPLESAPANRLVFAHLNTSDGFFTELGIFNPSAQAARVTLACFKPDGASLGQTSVNVPAGTVFGDYLDNLVSGARFQAAGYFTLSSDQPIVAGAAFGTDSGSALAGLPPQILPSTSTTALATVSAASFLGQTLAADSIVAAFGVNLANSVVTANQVPLPTTLADTTVEVRDSLGVERLAPLFFVAPGQINYLIPPGTANGTATVTVTNGAGTMALGNVTIAPVAPGLFTANANGQGVAAAVALRIKASGAQSYETIGRFDAATQRFVSTPIDLGPTGEQVFLLLFGTGLRGRSSLNATAASIGGASASVSYAGAQGDLVGLDQVNVAVPRALLGRGEVDIVLMMDGKAANTARVNIK